MFNIQNIQFVNFLFFLSEFFVSLLYFFSSFALGSLFFEKYYKNDLFRHFISLGIGIFFVTIINIIFGILFEFNDFHFYFVTSILLSLSITFFILNINLIIKQLISFKIFVTTNYLFFLFLILIFITIGSYCFSNYSGADLGINHLPYLDSFIREQKIIYQNNWFASGYNISWQVFGYIPYYISGQNAYLGLSFWIYIIFFLMTIKILSFFSINKDKVKLLVAVLFSSLIYILNDSIPSNDIVVLFFQVLLSITILLFYENYKKQSIKYEKFYLFFYILISSLTVSIKLTALPYFAILNVYIFFKSPKKLFFILLYLFLGIPISFIWQFFEMYSTQSLPTFIDYINFDQNNIRSAANNELMIIHSNWYLTNLKLFAHYFMLPMLFSVLLLIPKNFSILKKRKFIYNFLLISFCSYLTFIVLVPRVDIIFHNRYHLITIIGICLSSFYIYLNAFNSLKYSKIHNYFKFFCYLTIFVSFFIPSKMVFPDASPDEPSSKVNSLFIQVFFNFKNKSLSRENEILSFINNQTADETIIATQSMNIYGYKRKVIQINPLSINTFKLSQTPDELISILKDIGVKYIHFNPYPGYVPGLKDKLEKYNTNLNNIKKSKNVKLIKLLKINENQYEELYEIL